MEFEGNVIQVRSAREPGHLQGWPRGVSPWTRETCRRRRGDRSSGLGPEHEGDDAILAPVRAFRDTGRNAIAQNRGPIAQSRYLGHAMRNENHCVASLAPALHHRVN